MRTAEVMRTAEGVGVGKVGKCRAFGTMDNNAMDAMEMLRDMNSAAKLVSDSVCVFVIIFCGLNWLMYRRARKK